MKKSLLFKLFALVACLMCALGASAAEAYACFTSTDSTLTFYYDGLSSTRPGTIYSLNTSYSYPGWVRDQTCSDVMLVVFDSSFADARPTSTSRWFAGMSHLKSIAGMAYLNTSEVTEMNSMFSECKMMASLDLSHLNTANVTDMSCMFNGFSSDESSTLDLSSFNTDKVTDMLSMFGGCRGLTSLYLSSFNTSDVTNMQEMFFNCSNLTTIYVDDGWSTAAVTSSDNMFTYCTSLVGGAGTTYDASHVGKDYAHIDGGTSNPGYFTDINTTLEPEAYACFTPSDSTLTFYYDTQRNSRPGTTYDLNTGSNEPGWYTDNTYSSVTQVVFDPSFASARPTSAYNWFYNMRRLQTITGMTEYLNTEEVTSMYCMFYYCKALTALDLSSFNTEKVTSMQSMFMYCSGLTTLDLRSFNTEKVTNMQYMFGFSPGLTSLDLSSFNPKKVSNMYGMFYQCTNLVTIYVGSDWNTGAVSTSGNGGKYLFKNCTSLVGGMGTAYDADHEDVTYAHIDGGPSNPGYFTAPPEAYACYTAENTTLTFYYDSQRSTRPGMTYDLNTGENLPDWYTSASQSTVTQAVFDPSFSAARPTTTRSWFHNMGHLQSITGMEYLNTSEVTNMFSMFQNCSSLTSLDMSGFNTSKVTKMAQLFFNCSGLPYLNVSNFNTANVTDMDGMFYMCHGLTSLDLSRFNTAKVARMNYMFYECINLIKIYAGNEWTTDAVTSSMSMFSYCSSIAGGMGTTYDTNHLDAAYAHIDGGPDNPGYFSELDPEAYACYTPSDSTLTFFYDTERITRPGTTYGLNEYYSEPRWHWDGTYSSVAQVVFDPSFADARPTRTIRWFEDMVNLQSIEGMEYLNTSDVTSMLYMFLNCSSLTSLDLSSFDTGNVANMCEMFQDCSNLVTIYAGSGWSTAAVQFSDDMFKGCTSLVGGQGTTYDANHVGKAYAHIDGGPSNPGYFTAEGAQPWTEPEAYACFTPSDSTLTFYYDGQRSTHDGTTYDLNTGSNEPGWYTDNTCSSVTQVVFDPSFANARPKSAYRWFSDMLRLQAITGMTEYLNTEEMTSMYCMFYYCKALTSLDLSGFNTEKVTSMQSMFMYCSGLTTLDLSSFNTEKVTSMQYMFGFSPGFTSLNLSSFNPKKVSNMYGLFYQCRNLATIYVGSDWNTQSVSAGATGGKYLFKNCTSLVGGMGTTYDADHEDVTYAHIDGGPSNPGYFTAVSTVVRGDVDGDGSVDITDATMLINYLLSGNASGLNLENANCDQEGGVDISDATMLINYLLNGHW